MPSTASPIQPDIDLDADGVQLGYLRLPHSVHRSAYGWLPIPVASVRNGTGPVVLLMGGNHGDEYEGQIALGRLIRNLDPGQVTGQLIILPMANYPAARAGLRTSPLDDGNLNRSFPGDPRGGPTAVIAHYIESELLARADYLLDIHSGGSSLEYRSLAIMARPATGAARADAEQLLHSLGLERAIVYDERPTDGFSGSAAGRQGTMAVTIEIAGGGTVNRHELVRLEAGLESCLRHIGCLAGAADYRQDVLFGEVGFPGSYCYAMDAGLFEPAVDLGSMIAAGDIAGWIHDPATPGRPPVQVRFEAAGCVVCRRVPAQVQRGDCLFEIARPVDNSGQR